MDQNNIAQFTKTFEQLEKIDVAEKLALIYRKESDYLNQRIGHLLVSDFLSLLVRIQTQGRAIIDSGLLPLLPQQIHIEGNNFVVSQMVGNIARLLNQPNLGAAETHARMLDFVFRVYAAGLGDPAQKPSEVQLEKAASRIDLITAQSKGQSEKLKGLLNSSAGLQGKLTELYKTKTKELAEIKSKVGEANQSLQDLQKLLNLGTEHHAKLESFRQEQARRTAEAEKALGELRASIKSAGEQQTKLADAVEARLKDFETKKQAQEAHLTFIEGKREFFEERLRYLEDLIGREVGASLFETFKQRKVELQRPVTRWSWLVILVSILTVAGIFGIFSGFLGTTPKNLNWVRFGLNTLKTVPLFIMLFFVIRQYGRERTFQEQYAFKSAVALTIKAYADIIQDQAKKDDLVFNAVSGIYVSPLTLDGKHHKGNAKALLGTLNNAIDAFKSATKS